MKKRYSWLLLVVTILFTIGTTSCDKNNGDDPQDPGSQDTVQVDRSNMFGMQEQPTVCANITAGSDKGVTPDLVANLCGALGVKSFRLGMNIPWVLEYNSAGELVFRQPNIQNFKDYAALLRQHGVRNIILSNTMYMYPYGASRSWWRAVPEPGTELYIKFMEQIEKSYEMIAGAFPDITYFEVGNEMNAPKGINLCKEGFIGTATAEQNAPYIFTTAEQALITADICYYANRGVKSVNPNGKIVAPAPYMIDSLARNYLTSIYDQIKSGSLPTSRLDQTTQIREIAASTNPSDYFEYLNWHPYTTGGAYTLEWVRQNEALYQVAVDHGDANRKIVMTEFGYFDSYLERREVLIGNACVPAIEVLADRLKTLETVFLFRMFNWTTPPTGTATAEQTYGLFDSPLQTTAVRPKPIALSLFFHYNGVSANPDPLYKYMK